MTVKWRSKDQHEGKRKHWTDGMWWWEGNFVRCDAGDGERKAGLMGQMLGAVADSLGNLLLQIL